MQKKISRILYAIVDEDAEARFDQKEAIRQLSNWPFQETLMPSKHSIVSGMLKDSAPFIREIISTSKIFSGMSEISFPVN